MTRPTADQFATAAAWLRVNEGDNGEAEACAAVANWIDDQEFESMLRREARKAGVPMARLRRKLAEVKV